MIKLQRWLPGIVCLAVLGIAAASFGADEPMKKDAAKAKPAMHAMAKPVMWPADQLKWMDAPGGLGVKVAVLWGDPMKGAFGAIHKFPAGFKSPLHTHSSDLHNVVISGTIIHGEADGKETRLPAGSYEFLPHTDKHTTSCDAASECQLFVQGNGKFDLKMAK